MSFRILALFALSFVLVVLSGCTAEKPRAALPPQTVQVVTVEPAPIQIYAEAPAQTYARNKVDVRGRVDGYLEKWLFRPGDTVSAGQVLYELDKRPFLAVLNEARGNLNQAKADLEYAQTQVSLNEANANLATADAARLKAKQYYDRVKVLVKEGAVSEQDYDSAHADLLASQGVVKSRSAAVTQANVGTKTQIEGARAKVEAQRGLVQRAELNVSYCTIKAPISGLIGESLVPVGGLVTANSMTPLTTIVPLNPLWVRYKVTESQHLRNPAAHQSNAALELFLADGSRYPFTGTVTNTLNEVDRQTGTLEIQAQFPNPQGRLLPGQFGRVRFIEEKRAQALSVPTKAIQQTQSLSSVFVVDRNNQVESRIVRLGPRIAESIVIEDGLKAGERVVVEGQLGIRAGAKVNAIPAVGSYEQTANKTPIPLQNKTQTAQGPGPHGVR